MSFTSTSFVVFFALFLVLYHLVGKKVYVRNLLLIAGSYFFYGWWDWRFLGLIILSTTVDFIAGRMIEHNRLTDRRKMKRALAASLVVNLGSLGFFKYCNFFIDNLAFLLNSLGVSANIHSLSLILPVGISFYTFQSLAYTIGVYRGDLQAEKDWKAFYAYISFFPQLAAGPIEKPTRFLPQFHVYNSPTGADIERAIWMIAWGYFLKVVVADSTAGFVDAIFRMDQFLGWSTILGTLLFGIQIYGDFCGYSYIAKGVAALLGFELMWNFDRPYWSTSIREFWRRWHISLSQWLRDYIYIPLGGNRRGRLRTRINIMITMLLGGLWHGAGWNFVLWGALHGGALVCNHLWMEANPQRRLNKGVAWLLTATVVLLGWFLFRATSWKLMEAMVVAFNDMRWMPGHTGMLQAMVLLSIPVVLVEWMQKRTGDLTFVASYPLPVRSLATGACAIAVFAFSDTVRSSFVYFQF